MLGEKYRISKVVKGRNRTTLVGPVADAEFPRWEGGTNSIIWQDFAKNCMKMKKIGSGVGTRS